MNSFRKVIGLLLAIAWVVFASAAIAGPSKSYDLHVALGTGGPKQVVATLVNLSNPLQGSGGNSNMGSLILTVDTALAGVRIDESSVSLSRVDGSGNPLDTNNWNISAYPNPLANLTPSISITNMQLKGMETLTITMNVDGCGSGNLWGTTIFTGSSLSGDQFLPYTDPAPLPASQLLTDVACGPPIACGFSTNVFRTDLTNDPSVVPVTRGPYNSDGSCDASTIFFVNNRLPTNNKSVQLVWPFFGAGNEAAFEFDANVFKGANPLALAFKNYAGTYTPVPAYLNIATNPALTCSAANSTGDWFPKPYGTLGAAITGASTTISINSSGNTWLKPPKVLPTNLIIDDELMTVTKVQGSTWTVTRYGPPAYPNYPSPTNHSLGAMVMYTPLKQFGSSAPSCLNVPTGSSCPYVAQELAKSCLIPTSTDGAYRIMGIGDPVFSGGGDL